MRLLSVIDRELRSSARQSFTYSLRVLGVVSLFVVLGLFCLSGDLGPEIGGHLFGWLHGTLFCGIWLLVPLLTADCISRERRDGTLPLLFLTNLNPRQIVYAKSFAQGLRACTLWLAVLPLMTVPLVAGGVGWVEVVMSTLVNFSALCLGTAAGVTASAGSRVWSRALTSALCLAALLFIGFLMVLPVSVIWFGAPRAWLRFWAGQEIGPIQGFVLASNWGGCWQEFLARAGQTRWRLLGSYACVALGSLFLLLMLIRFAAWRVRKVWRDEPPSARMEWLQRQLFTPVLFQRVLRQWLNWQLVHNPIGWLGHRSWVGRVVVWSWFAVVMCIYSSLFSNLYLYQRGFHDVQYVVSMLLAGSIAMSAAGSFRRERDSGMLELLLISPIREWEIIGGRVRGLWLQFMPAIVLLVVVWLYSATFLQGADEGELGAVLVFTVSFLTLPVIGLYFSLAKSNFISALVWTLLSGLILPGAIGQIALMWVGPIVGSGFPAEALLAKWVLPSLVRIALALVLGWVLQQRLRFRRFDFDKKS